MINFIVAFQISQTPMLDYRKNQVLAAIRQVESRNCQNLKHSMVKSGLHRGQYAIGCYGLMPNTIKFIHKRYLKRLISLDDIMVSISSENQFKDILNVDYEVSGLLYDYLNQRYHGDTFKLIYSWLNGSVGQNSLFKSHWYTKRVAKLL